MLARLGQQSGVVANAFIKLMPLPANSLWTLGMYWTDWGGWSSVRMSMMFGRFGSGLTAAVGCLLAPEHADVSSTMTRIAIV